MHDNIKKRINIAAKRQPADLVIKNCKIVNVFTHEIIEGDIAISDGKIAAVGNYSGEKEVDAEGRYALPGFINSHIHIESSFVSPEEFSRLVVPHGTTTIIADPHEIVNVCGMDGFDYMVKAGKNAALDIKYMIPSCVPCTPWEHAGAVVDSKAISEVINQDKVFGMGEFMNTVGVINTDSEVLEKISLCHQAGKVIDGHSPGLKGMICLHMLRQEYIQTTKAVPWRNLRRDLEMECTLCCVMVLPVESFLCCLKG